MALASANHLKKGIEIYSRLSPREKLYARRVVSDSLAPRNYREFESFFQQVSDSGRRPTVFLSHSHADKPFVRRLAELLSDANIECWLDEAELRVGESLVERLSDALADVDFVLVVLSPASVKSAWVQEELKLAMNRQIERRGVIILPVVKRSCEIPSYLEGRLRIDFSSAKRLKENFSRLVTSIQYHFQRIQHLNGY